MARTTDLTDQPDPAAAATSRGADATPVTARASGPGSQARRLVVEFRGRVAAATIVASSLGAVSEIVLPMTFAAVLAIIFKPLVGVLQRKG